MHPSRVRFVAPLVAMAVLLMLPAAVAGHSELVSSSPAADETIQGSPDQIVLTFTDELNQARSAADLLDPGGTVLTGARPDPSQPDRIVIDPPDLAPGTYEVRWTSVALDNDLVRGTFEFTVTAAASPSPSTTAVSSASAVPSASASPATSIAPTPTATGAPAPGPAGTADAAIPIVAGLVIVLGLGAWLLRRRATG